MHSKLFSTRNLIAQSPALSLVRADENSKFEFKLWHLGVLVGIPSAAILSYLLYRKLKQQSISKQTNIKKSDSSETQKNEIKKTQPKTPLEIAIDKKGQGNRHFQNKEFDKAVECYTDAILSCPQDDTNELPKFYQNRAAAYENLVHFQIILYLFIFIKF